MAERRFTLVFYAAAVTALAATFGCVPVPANDAGQQPHSYARRGRRRR
jgi:hypothetical protein